LWLIFSLFSSLVCKKLNARDVKEV
jgi:hypothetical protein